MKNRGRSDGGSDASRSGRPMSEARGPRSPRRLLGGAADVPPRHRRTPHEPPAPPPARTPVGRLPSTGRPPRPSTMLVPVSSTLGASRWMIPPPPPPPGPSAEPLPPPDPPRAAMTPELATRCFDASTTTPPPPPPLPAAVPPAPSARISPVVDDRSRREATVSAPPPALPEKVPQAPPPPAFTPGCNTVRACAAVRPLPPNATGVEVVAGSQCSLAPPRVERDALCLAAGRQRRWSYHGRSSPSAHGARLHDDRALRW